MIINVNAFEVDETVLLPKAVKAVVETIDVLLCLERKPRCPGEGLGCGRPIISSVT